MSAIVPILMMRVARRAWEDDTLPPPIPPPELTPEEMRRRVRIVIEARNRLKLAGYSRALRRITDGR